MKISWILVCDSSRGRLFERRADNGTWELLQVLEHAESRSKATELASDTMGASQPKEVEKKHFGHTLATMLDQSLRSKKLDRLVLVAPPAFLGLLKGELTTELKKHLVASVDKDLTHFKTEELVERLGDLARVPLDQQDVMRPATKHAH